MNKAIYTASREIDPLGERVVTKTVRRQRKIRSQIRLGFDGTGKGEKNLRGVDVKTLQWVTRPFLARLARVN